jgi:hypothetical protein
MAATNRLTLLDFASTKDPNGTQAQVFELMNQYNPPMQDAPAFPSNNVIGNRTTYRRSLPAVGTAKINKGVTKSKSAADQRMDPIGYFAGRSEIDSRIQKIEGTAAFLKKRRDEDLAFEEAFAQLVCNGIFYGNTKLDEASFDGLAPRMASLNAGTSLKDPQVWSQGTVSGADGCSIYVVDWGERAAKLIYPPNTIAGLDVADKGEINVKDEDGTADMFAYVTAYDWFVGLAVEDVRHIGRLANIDTSDAQLDAPTQGKLIDSLEQIMSFMPDPGAAQRVLYCPFKLYASFSKQARSFANQALTIRDYLGRPTPHFWEFPLRRVEQLSITEPTVS